MRTRKREKENIGGGQRSRSCRHRFFLELSVPPSMESLSSYAPLFCSIIGSDDHGTGIFGGGNWEGEGIFTLSSAGGTRFFPLEVEEIKGRRFKGRRQCWRSLPEAVVEESLIRGGVRQGVGSAQRPCDEAPCARRTANQYSPHVFTSRLMGFAPVRFDRKFGRHQNTSLNDFPQQKCLSMNLPQTSVI
ncbi:hypothetical protein AAFF_G00207060 [Aldrovandia affinis]|uniref:Uncharacterized protein n=1 Tax=Aldrovandia affinis TaxID=143900 RepID=A0AAD7RHL3_9TELE|nr:hypothetical protein AAFF_G00207060 [Aldrovandia affinis]